MMSQLFSAIIHKGNKLEHVDSFRASNDKEKRKAVRKILKRCHDNGISFDFLRVRRAKKIRITKEEINEVIPENPLEIPVSDRLDYYADKIINEYKDGSSIKTLHKKYHVNYQKVRKLLVENNVEIRNSQSYLP